MPLRFFVLLMLLFSAWAQAAELIDPSSERQRLSGPTLELLIDADGRLSAEEAHQRRDFVSTNKRALMPGFSRMTYWLHGTVVNRGPLPLTRWLEVGSPRTEEIRYFAWRSGAADAEPAGPPESYLGGLKFGFAARPIAAESSLFPITLGPGERVDFYLQIRSRSAIMLNVELWDPIAFRTTEVSEHQRVMLLLGAILTISLYSLLQGLFRRDAILVLYGLWGISWMAYEHSFQGFAFRYFWPASPEWGLRATITFGALWQFLLFFLTCELINLRPFLCSHRWLGRAVLITPVLLLSSGLFADFSVVAPLLTWLSLLVNVSWPLLLLFAWRRRVPFANVIFLASTLVWLASMTRTLYLLGLISTSWLRNEEVVDVFYGGLVMLLILGGLSRVLLLQREKERVVNEQLLALDLRGAALEAAVVQRTSELQEAVAKADAANQGKNDFLARVSHDLRTPLTAIIGYADLIASAHRQDAERGRIIRRSAQHLLELIDDLIDFARGRASDIALEPVPHYLYGLLEEIAAGGNSLAKRRGNHFVLQAAADLPAVVELDGKRLRQVLNNLIGNAAKFTAGGEIRLSVARLLDESAAADSPVLLQFTVSDTGIGIAPEDQERVFALFEQVKRRDKGLGMGLAIVRQWVERMGGKISLHSTLGQGTAISFVLACPLAAESSVQHYQYSEKEIAASSWLGQGWRVLVVEDHQDIRELLTDGLENQGFIVEALADGAKAIARLTSPHEPLPALVLTDQWLPGADGNAVLQAVRQHAAGVPVILLSATPAAGDEGDGESFDATLLKPVSMSQLIFTIGRLLGLIEAPASEQALSALPATASMAAPLLPDAAHLAVLRQMVDLGAVSDIADWADQLQADDAAFTAFAEQVRAAAARLDLSGLKAMLSAG